MSEAAPTPSELMRRLNELVGEFRELRTSLDASFLRSKVYEADRTADAFQFKAVEDDLHQLHKRLDAADDRARKATSARWSLAFSAVAGPILVVVMLHAMGLLASAK